MSPRNLKGPRCKAKSKTSKKQCGRAAILGGTVCGYHGGKAPQVMKAAENRVREYVAQMVDPDRVLQEVARLAFSDIRQAFDENGALKDKHDWPDELAAAVSSTKSRRVNLDAADGHTDLVTELKVWDKPKNLETLCKHLGLLTERVEVTLKDELENRIKSGRDRIARAKHGNGQPRA